MFSFFLCLFFLAVNASANDLIGYNYQVISKYGLHYSELASTDVPFFSRVGVNNLGNTREQQYRKLQLPGTTHSVIVGETNVAILDKDKLLRQFLLTPHCNFPNEIDISTGTLVLSCQNGFIIAVIATNEGNYQGNNIDFLTSVPAFIVHGSNSFYVYNTRRNNLRRRKISVSIGIDQSLAPDVILYSSSEIMTTFGSCNGSWAPRSYNNSHFVYECFGQGKRFLVSGLQKDIFREISAVGTLNIFRGRDEAVILKENSFTFYKNGFEESCTVTLPLPVIRIDYGLVHNTTVLVFFSDDRVLIYNTGKGCKDYFLEQLANGTFPCLHGNCDGYFIIDNGYILITSNTRGIYQVRLYNLNEPSSYFTVINLDSLPKGINVVKIPVTFETVTMSPLQLYTSVHLYSQTSTFYNNMFTVHVSSPSVTSPFPTAEVNEEVSTGGIAVTITACAIVAIIAIILAVVVSVAVVFQIRVNSDSNSTQTSCTSLATSMTENMYMFPSEACQQNGTEDIVAGPANLQSSIITDLSLQGTNSNVSLDDIIYHCSISQGQPN